MKLTRFGTFTLGVLVTAVSVGAVSFAHAAGDATIKACASKKTGTMRYISKGKCKKSEKALSWNQMGPQGLPGSAGINGAAGTKGDIGATTESSPTGFTARSVCGANGTELCAIGSQGPGGGTIFHVDSSNEILEFDYLEAAPTNAVFHGGAASGVWANNEPTCGVSADAPCDVAYVSDAAFAMETYGLGTGRTATKAIVARFRKSDLPKTAYAAGVADSYETVTASDWWLPSWDESIALCQFAVRQLTNDGRCNGGAIRPGFIDGAIYWTSTGFTFGVLGHNYSDGGGGLVGKKEGYFVHPIRGF